MTTTADNLATAFAGESQANRKYLAFAQKAQTEGYPQVAKLFRAAAEAETVHAHTHLRTLKGVKSTLENLKEALGGETYEFQSMYPPMIQEAKAEGNEAAVRTFTYANEVEKVYAALYQKAIDSLTQPQADVDYYVCSVCGYTVEKEAPEECPVCKAKKKVFMKVS